MPPGSAYLTAAEQRAWLNARSSVEVTVILNTPLMYEVRTQLFVHNVLIDCFHWVVTILRCLLAQASAERRHAYHAETYAAEDPQLSIGNSHVGAESHTENIEDVKEDKVGIEPDKGDCDGESVNSDATLLDVDKDDDDDDNRYSSDIDSAPTRSAALAGHSTDGVYQDGREMMPQLCSLQTAPQVWRSTINRMSSFTSFFSFIMHREFTHKSLVI